MSTEALLQASLAAAVPLWIEQVRDMAEKDRRAKGRELADILAYQGDVLLYRSKKKGETAKVFNALAEAMACLAFQPGGVTAFGLHFRSPDARW